MLLSSVLTEPVLSVLSVFCILIFFIGYSVFFTRFPIQYPSLFPKMGTTKGKAGISDVENVLGCGGYQIFVFIIYQLSVFLQCSNMAFMAFGKVTGRWWCQGGNGTNESIGWNESEQCALFSNGTCGEIGWETDFYSIVPEWNLICDRKGIVYLIMSIQMLGVLIGSPIFGQLSDAFGRKWTLFFSQLIVVFLDALSILSPSWQIFLAFRFFIGFSCGGVISISFVYLMEAVKSRHRLWVTTIGGWSPAFGVFAALAYVTRDWRQLSLAIGGLGILPTFMLPLAAESPRWLIQKQKLAEAEKSVEKVMKWNREKEAVKARLAHVISGQQFQHQHPLRQNLKELAGKTYSFWHLCQTSKMAVNTGALAFTFLSISMITYGIILNNDKLIGDKYLNFFLFACIRWISSILTPLVDMSIKGCGRKLTSSVSFGVMCLAAVSISLILIFEPNSPIAGRAITGLVLLASMVASPIWASLNLTSVEAFPTPIRNTAVGVCAVFNRLGGVIVPVFLYMAELWKPSPYVLFAVMAFLSAALCGFLLPETKGTVLPDKMPQPHERWLKKGLKKPEGTIRSDSFTVYQFHDTRVS